MMLKNKLHLVFYIIVVFTIYSCNVLKEKDILGRYDFRTKISKGSLILNKDNTFEYNYEAPMLSYTSKGKWSLDRKNIALKSNDFFLNDFMEVKENYSENGIIKVLDEKNIPIEGVSIKVNNRNDWLVTDKRGIVSLQSNVEIDTIAVEYIDLSKQIYLVKDKNSKAFQIRIIAKDYSKIFFDNYLGKINKKEIRIYNQKYIKSN